jgi:hypothetical protein
MTPLLEAALEFQTLLEKWNWKFCIIGGIAVLRWGEPRYTRDVDLTLLTGFGREEQFIAPILEAGYKGRIPDVAVFAAKNRVMLLDSPSGVPFDVALAGLPFEEQMVDRATLFEFEPGCLLRTCSAEDLVIQKLFAFRKRDVLDADTIVTRHGNTLDWSYIERHLSDLAELKEEPEIMEYFSKIRLSGQSRP